MGRGPLSFKSTDVVRAMKAANLSGMDIVRTEIMPDGRIVFVHRFEGSSQTQEETYEEWKARNGEG